jgi:hypothetical protein
MTVVRADTRTVLTNHPHIVIARPPKRTRKPKPGPKISRVIVGPHEPAPSPSPTAPGEPATKPAVIVGREPAPPMSEEEYKARGDAADQLFREMVRRVKERDRS